MILVLNSRVNICLPWRRLAYHGGKCFIACLLPHISFHSIEKCLFFPKTQNVLCLFLSTAFLVVCYGFIMLSLSSDNVV